MEAWASGSFDAPSFEESLLINAAVRGGISVIDEILKFDHTMLRGNNE